MSAGPYRGWKDRRTKAATKDFDGEERARIREERQKIYQVQIDAANAAEADRKVREKTARVSCPCCGEGLLEAEFAARIVTALHRLPAHVQADPAVLSTLNAIVEGSKPVELAAAYSTDLGLKRPKKVYASAPLAEHGDPAQITPKDAPIVVPTKPKRKPTNAELYAADGDENALDLG